MTNNQNFKLTVVIISPYKKNPKWTRQMNRSEQVDRLIESVAIYQLTVTH